MTRVAGFTLAICLSAGCSWIAPKSTPESCAPACEHLVEMQMEPVRHAAHIQVHEMEEQLEGQEADVKRITAQVKEEMKIVRPPFEKTLDFQRKNVSKAGMLQLRQTYDMEAAQLKVQQQAALKAEDEFITGVRKNIEVVRKKVDQGLAKQKADEVVRCDTECVTNWKKKQVECVTALPTADELNSCEVVMPQAPPPPPPRTDLPPGPPPAPGQSTPPPTASMASDGGAK